MNAQLDLIRKWFYLLAFSLAAVISHENSAFAVPKTVEIRSIQVLGGSETDFAISATGNFQFYMFALKNPDRLVIDCWPAVLTPGTATMLPQGHPSVSGIRAAHFQKDVVRVVFDLKGPGKFSALAQGADLRIRIAKHSQTKIQTESPAIQIPSQQNLTFHESLPKASIQAPNSTTNLDFSISSQKGEVIGSGPSNKNQKRRLPMKMQGYVGDKFQKNVVSGKYREASAGSFYGMNLRYKKQNKRKNASLHFTYNIFGYEYAQPFAEDYMYQDFAIGYELKLSPKWSVKTVGRVELAEYGDRYGLRPELVYRLTPRSQFSVFGGHRTKLIPDYQERTDQERFFGFSYKSKIIRNQTLQLSYQHAFNNSERKRYDYNFSRYTVGYTVPWSRQSRTLFELDYTPRHYVSRFVKVDSPLDPEFNTLREDQGYTFSIISRFRLTRHLELEPRYIYMIKNSNEPFLEDYTLHVPSIALHGSW